MSTVQRFVLGDEERMVQETAREFVANRMPVTAMRALRDEAASFDAASWSEMAALGWPGIAIAEEYGGAGLGIRALGAVIEEMGRTLGASPLASSALVAATVIARFGSGEIKANWLPRIADGSVVAALAVDETAHPGSATATTLAQGNLDGTKRYVA